jgi:hypothetical protein
MACKLIVDLSLQASKTRMCGRPLSQKTPAAVERHQLGLPTKPRRGRSPRTKNSEPIDTDVDSTPKKNEVHIELICPGKLQPCGGQFYALFSHNDFATLRSSHGSSSSTSSQQLRWQLELVGRAFSTFKFPMMTAGEMTIGWRLISTQAFPLIQN